MLGIVFVMMLVLLCGYKQAATTSQFFISYTIRTFGALVFATIMTTRQVVNHLIGVFVLHFLAMKEFV